VIGDDHVPQTQPGRVRAPRHLSIQMGDEAVGLASLSFLIALLDRS
jgi:hypothetical protein